MAYEEFTKSILFKDQNINTVCNRIIALLISEFGESTIQTKFCLTGTVAKIFQGASLEDITVIPFVTNDVEVFEFCRKELPALIKATAFNLTDRVQVNRKGVFFEFWYESDLGTINTVNGIQLEDPSDISIKIK